MVLLTEVIGRYHSDEKFKELFDKLVETAKNEYKGSTENLYCLTHWLSTQLAISKYAEECNVTEQCMIIRLQEAMQLVVKSYTMDYWMYKESMNNEAIFMYTLKHGVVDKLKFIAQATTIQDTVYRNSAIIDELLQKIGYEVDGSKMVVNTNVAQDLKALCDLALNGASFEFCCQHYPLHLVRMVYIERK